METVTILLVIIIVALIGIGRGISAQNDTLHNIYTEVTEIHNKMGGWSSDIDD